MQTEVLDRKSMHHEVPVMDRQEVEEPVEREVRTGEGVRNEFAKLWNMYTGRRAGLLLEIGNQTIEDDVLATRYFHEQDIEETYWRTRLYEQGSHLKGGARLTELIFIHISTEFYEHEIHVDEAGEIHVRMMERESGEWFDADEEGAAGIVEGFFERAAWAAMAHSNRTPEERQTSDNAALGLLYERHPEIRPPARDGFCYGKHVNFGLWLPRQIGYIAV